MKTQDELIDTIKIIDGNLQHIAETGKVNGTLRAEITRVMNQFLESRTINLDKTKLMYEFEEYMMSNMKPFTPDNVFEWFFRKIEEIGASVCYTQNDY